jgi:hypothetical protein
MSFKTTYLLFGLLGALVLLLVVVLLMGPTPPLGSDYLLSGMRDKANPIKPDDVTRVEIVQKKPEEKTLVFERDAESKTWKITSPRSLAADQRNVNAVVDQLYEARKDETEPTGGLNQLGLDDPQRVITLTAKGKEITVKVGDITPGKSNALAYVLADQARKAAAVKKQDIEAVFEDLDYFRDKDLLGRDQADIRSIKVAEGKKQPVELKRVRDQWRISEPPLGTAEIGNLLQDLTNLTVHYKDKKDSDFVADEVKDLAAYHLDPAKDTLLRIEVGRGEETKPLTTRAVVIGIGKKVQDAAKKEENRYYAYVDTGSQTPDIVRVEAKTVEPFLKLAANPENLRNKTLVSIPGSPDAIDIENSYGHLEFLRAEPLKPWELYRGTTANPIEESEVQLLISNLTKKDLIQSFPDPKRLAELGLGKDRKPDAVVKIYSNGLEKPPADKPGKPTYKKGIEPLATLRFGNRERGSVAVERIVGNESTLVMVPENVREVVVRGPLAYFDKNLPSFTSNDPRANVTRVVVERDGTTYEVTRDKATDPWKLTKPANLAGRLANARVIDEILKELDHVRALEIVAEKADDNTLARDYNLKSPPYRVSITLTPPDSKPEGKVEGKAEGKATTHVYSLGKEVAGKGYYAKVGDKDTIYLVSSEVAAPLKKDFQDTTVFRFDTDKVQSVKLSGWKKLIGSVTTRTFEKKDGKWSVKEDATYTVDEEKLKSFLNPLSHLQAERFVSAGKEMSPDQDALTIEIRLEDQKDPLQLVVGGQEGSSYVASSPQLKGDFFLVPTSLFEGPRSRPAWFSK